MKLNGVSLRTAGKIYYYKNDNDLNLTPGDRVVLETHRGVDIATVREVDVEREAENIDELTSIIRKATNEDVERSRENRTKELSALHLCRDLVKEHNLDMQLIDVQSNLDNSLYLFYFLAEHRIDFRELVKSLAKELRCRIELRQVGIRDEAKILGGFGMCGRQLCCSSFLDNFVSVSISMAKDQGMALNPQKISGMCGRLMCCLSYECEHYRDKQADMPRVNSMVITPNGEGKVIKQNIMAQQVEVVLSETGESFCYPVEEVDAITKDDAKANTRSGCCGKDKRPDKNNNKPCSHKHNAVLPDEVKDEATLVAEYQASKAQTKNPNTFETVQKSAADVIVFDSDRVPLDDDEDMSSLLNTAPPEKKKNRYNNRRKKNN